MKGKWSILVLVAFLCTPGWALAVSQDDFELDTAADLVELCTAPETDPLHREAISFCYGFLVGSFHYHVAEYGGIEKSPFICPPEPPPPRAQIIKEYMDWSKKHPQYMNEEAMHISI